LTCDLRQYTPVHEVCSRPCDSPPPYVLVADDPAFVDCGQPASVSRCSPGFIGYRHFENLPWTDAFVNAAMILSGMGPMKTDLSPGGKVFAGLYALYSGILVIAVAGLLLAPAIHRVMHRVHWDDQA
jgi:hypothetical protein